MKGKILLKLNFAPRLFNSCFIFSPSITSSYPIQYLKMTVFSFIKPSAHSCQTHNKQQGTEICNHYYSLLVNTSKHDCCDQNIITQILDSVYKRMLALHSLGQIQMITLTPNSPFLPSSVIHRYHTQKHPLTLAYSFFPSLFCCSVAFSGS